MSKHSTSAYKGTEHVRSVTILNTASLSDALDLGDNHRPVGLVTPSTFEPTTLTFEVSVDGTTFVDLYKADGTEYRVTVGTDQYVPLPPADFIGVRHLKVRGGTAASPTTVGADRVVQVVAEP